MAAISHLARLIRAGYVMAREGAFGLVDPDLAPPAARLPLRMARWIERRGAGNGAARLAAALGRLGPSYVKFGQFGDTARSRGHTRRRRPVEPAGPHAPFPMQEAKAVVEAALTRPLGTLFADFSEPVAAASIAQVHKARTHAGRVLAVKVLRPGVRARFRRDLDAMRFAARLAERHSAEARRLRLGAVVETLARSVDLEMDLRLEAAALSELAENTRRDRDFRCPKPVWDLTARDTVAMEWIDAIPLGDLAAIDAAGLDRKALARTIIQSFLKQAIRDGFFHADMHQGNLFVDRKGRLVAVDCGIMGRLGIKERRFLAEILLGFIERDYTRVAEVHFTAGYVPAHHKVADFAQAIRAVGEPIHDRPADQISMAKVLTLLFEITGLFNMTTRTELVMLQKTMVVVEGVARTLDPQLDMWNTAEPIVRDWILHNLGPAGRMEEAGRGLLALARVALDAPDLVARAERAAATIETVAAEGLPLAPQSVAAIGRAEARRARWGHAALWAIAGLLAVIARRLF